MLHMKEHYMTELSYLYTEHIIPSENHDITSRQALLILKFPRQLKREQVMQRIAAGLSGARMEDLPPIEETATNLMLSGNQDPISSQR